MRRGCRYRFLCEHLLGSRDGDDVTEDDLLRQDESAEIEKAGDRAESEADGGEPDDGALDAAELRRLSQPSRGRMLLTLIYATTPARMTISRV